MENDLGMLVVCAGCKAIRIREDTAKWEINPWALERLINAYGKDNISHGICPTCIEELYGEYLK